MQKVEGSSPFSRSLRSPANCGVLFGVASVEAPCLRTGRIDAPNPHTGFADQATQRRIAICRYADIISVVTEATADQLLEVFKALANPTRLQIMSWLRDPAQHFAPQADPMDEVGVCVKQIQEKAGISQSTASQFMSVLQRAGLVQGTRVGPWTYYRRNESRVAEVADLLGRSV